MNYLIVSCNSIGKSMADSTTLNAVSMLESRDQQYFVRIQRSEATPTKPCLLLVVVQNNLLDVCGVVTTLLIRNFRI